jgi:RNA polymerase primary sigma factor
MPHPIGSAIRARSAHFETYLREINETPLLSEQEEKDLAERIDAGDAQARDHMVRANLRLVVKIARRYTSRGELQDLIEEGNLGLLRAVEGYDPSMNTRFSTYASFWIRQSIKRALVNMSKPIRVPVYMVDLLTKWREATVKLREELGRAPTQEEIARTLNLPKKQLISIRKAIRVYNNTGMEFEPAHPPWSLDELNSGAKTPERMMEESDDLHQILNFLATMDVREIAVLRMRFGFEEEAKTLQEIGDVLGLTRERVRQIEHEALAKLRAVLGDG